MNELVSLHAAVLWHALLFAHVQKTSSEHEVNNRDVNNRPRRLNRPQSTTTFRDALSMDLHL